MTPTIRERAEELAGPHTNSAPTMSCMTRHSATSACSCGQAERVAGILKLMEASEELDIINTGKSPCGHWSAYARTNDGGRRITCLQCEVEAAEAKVRELEAEGYKALLKQPKSVWLDAIIEAARSEARKAALEEAATAILRSSSTTIEGFVADIRALKEGS